MKSANNTLCLKTIRGKRFSRYAQKISRSEIAKIQWLQIPIDADFSFVYAEQDLITVDVGEAGQAPTAKYNFKVNGSQVSADRQSRLLRVDFVTSMLDWNTKEFRQITLNTNNAFKVGYVYKDLVFRYTDNKNGQRQIKFNLDVTAGESAIHIQCEDAHQVSEVEALVYSIRSVLEYFNEELEITQVVALSLQHVYATQFDSNLLGNRYSSHGNDKIEIDILIPAGIQRFSRYSAEVLLNARMLQNVEASHICESLFDGIACMHTTRQYELFAKSLRDGSNPLVTAKYIDCRNSIADTTSLFEVMVSINDILLKGTYLAKDNEKISQFIVQTRNAYVHSSHSASGKTTCFPELTAQGEGTTAAQVYRFLTTRLVQEFWRSKRLCQTK